MGNVRQVNPTAVIIALSCRTGDGLEVWFDWLEDAVEARRVKSLVTS
jgi:hydrogenase nickel incorporation protein HypB